MSGDLYDGTARALSEGWGVAPNPDAPGQDDDTNWRLLREALEERLSWLMKHDMGKLTTAMYLLDVPERHYHVAMGQPGVEGKARALAELVLVRETERMRTRLYYSRRRQLE